MSRPDYVTNASISPEKISWMEKFLPSKVGNALDLGCGAGLYSMWLRDRGWKVCSVDLEEPPKLEGIETRKHNLEEGLPRFGRTFDLILAWDVLEHVAADQALWKQISDILFSGGVLLGSVPHSADERLRKYNLTYKHHTDKTHQREYSPEDVKAEMQRVTLEVLDVELKGPVSPQIVSEFLSFSPGRKLFAKGIGLARRLGIFSFQEFYGDVFFAGRKK